MEMAGKPNTNIPGAINLRDKLAFQFNFYDIDLR